MVWLESVQNLLFVKLHRPFVANRRTGDATKYGIASLL
jgi:hypothetical protein